MACEYIPSFILLLPFTLLAQRAGSVIGGYSQVTDGANVRLYGAVGDGATNDSAAFVNALSSGHKELILPSGEYRLTNGLSIPDSVTLVMNPGAKIRLANLTDTLRINGSFAPVSVLSQCFTGNGHVVFGPGAITDVYPEWWGINGITDNVAIQKAINSLPHYGGIIHLSNKTYVLTDAVAVNKNAVSIIGGSSTTIDVRTTNKFAFVSGDSAKIYQPFALANTQHTYRNLNFTSTSGTPAGMIVLYRTEMVAIDRINRFGGFAHSPTTIGIRLVGSDWGTWITNCTFNGYYNDCLGVGISIEDGSNQCYIEHNQIAAITPIQIWNNTGTYISQNSLLACVPTNGVGYGIIVRTSKPCPDINWVDGNTQTDTWIVANWFEPPAGTKTIYDIYLGDSTAVNRTSGTFIRDNLYVSNITTRYLVYVNYADQTSIEGFIWHTVRPTTTKFVEITSHATNTTLRTPQITSWLNQYNGKLLDFVTDNGVNTSVVYQGSTDRGTATLGAGDSVQVSVAGVTSSSIILATFDENVVPALTVGPLTIAHKATNCFTIKATGGKGLKVQYWIAKR
jgi:hypothetical protein